MFKRTFIVLISLVLVSFAAYGQTYGQTPFRTDQQAYQFGYNEGYHHGMSDSEAGLNFDYTHSHHFQSGISYNSYVNARFRAGYIQGYNDGFYSNNSAYGDQNDNYYGEYRDRDRDRDADRDDHYYSGDYYNRDYQNGNYGGFVTVFTDKRFGGSRITFRAGQYPYLNGKLHKSIDSIELRGPVHVILFDKPNFRGKSIMIDGDVFNLDDYHFGDKAESMIVERN